MSYFRLEYPAKWMTFLTDDNDGGTVLIDPCMNLL
jgi:hypothetical protein